MGLGVSRHGGREEAGERGLRRVKIGGSEEAGEREGRRAEKDFVMCGGRGSRGEEGGDGDGGHARARAPGPVGKRGGAHTGHGAATYLALVIARYL